MTNPADRAAIEVMAFALRAGNTPNVEGATAALAALRDAGFWVERWRPIGDAGDDMVLVSKPHNPVRTATRMTSFEEGDTAWIIARSVGADPVAFAYDAPTHFAPLPPPPPAPRDV